jgi:hypothetical protein
MIACLLVRCGSSVYVQKKSCSLTGNGGAAEVASGDTRNRADWLSLPDVMVERRELVAAIVYNLSLKPKGCIEMLRVLELCISFWANSVGRHYSYDVVCNFVVFLSSPVFRVSGQPISQARSTTDSRLSLQMPLLLNRVRSTRLC